MYKLMLVDDEPLAIKAISHIVNNNFADIQIKAKTGNGSKAIELAREQKPDIIFMDIKLNGLNGLEAIKEIKKFIPETVIIIISAFDDFSFAQNAIKLGVMDYLLKPINKSDIINILEQAKDYLNKIKIETNEKILLKEKLSEKDVGSYSFYPPWELEKKLFNAITLGNKEQLIIELENLIKFLDKYNHLNEIINYFKELTAVIFRFFYEYIPAEKLNHIKPNQFQDKLNKTITKEDLFNTINDILITLTRLVTPIMDLKSNPLLTKVRNFIDKNYAQDINLDDIANYIAISPCYLSKLFKENYNLTIIDYLTRVRVNAAIKLLATTKLQVKEIAIKVGYNDSNYFSKVFKKITHKTPTEFRN